VEADLEAGADADAPAEPVDEVEALAEDAETEAVSEDDAEKSAKDFE
jgi:hypothetical protein